MTTENRLTALMDAAALDTEGRLVCPSRECGRSFLDEAGLRDHAESVHTFSDIRQLVSEAVREKYNRPGDYKANPVVPSIWSWVEDLSTDWVAFTVEGDTEAKMYKAGYTILDNQVTLGEAVEVVRRTVYDPVSA